MAMLITYPDGKTEIISEATRVDSQNFHEGMYDFYDKSGNLLTQISMDSGIKWEPVSATQEPVQDLLHKEASVPLFLRNRSEGHHGNEQDEKDEVGE